MARASQSCHLVIMAKKKCAFPGKDSQSFPCGGRNVLVQEKTLRAFRVVDVTYSFRQKAFNSYYANTGFSCPRCLRWMSHTAEPGQHGCIQTAEHLMRGVYLQLHGCDWVWVCVCCVLPDAQESISAEKEKAWLQWPHGEPHQCLYAPETELFPPRSVLWLY